MNDDDEDGDDDDDDDDDDDGDDDDDDDDDDITNLLVECSEDGFHSSQTRLDPSQFMLPRDGRSSAPSLAEMPLVNSNVNSPETDHHLLRTAEIEDIPERVHEQRNDQSLSYIK